MTNELRFGLIVALALAAWTNPARALDDSDKESIRVLSNEAAADYEQHQYEAAREKFSRAYKIAQVPKLAVWAARANEKLGHLVAAYELYRQALSLQPNDLWKADAQQQAQGDAQRELDQLQQRIAQLDIVIEGANADEVSVKVDNVPVPSALLGVRRFTDPGQRQIVGQHGDEIVTETATLAEGEKKQVILKFRNAPAPAVTPAGATPSGASAVPSSQSRTQPNGPVPRNTAPETASPLSNGQRLSDQGSARTSTKCPRTNN